MLSETHISCRGSQIDCSPAKRKGGKRPFNPGALVVSKQRDLELISHNIDYILNLTFFINNLEQLFSLSFHKIHSEFY